MFTIGIGLLLSCISVFLRDVFYIYGIVLTIWNYFTPVFYSLEIIPASIQPFFKLNPLYQFITAVRDIVLTGQSPSLMTLGVITLIGVGTLAIGSFIFKKNQDKYIYYI